MLEPTHLSPFATSARAPLPPGGQRPEVSVAIPTYNEEDNVVQITEAVIAALQPIVEHFEVVIIDNGSTDRTVELLRGLVQRYPFVRGIVNARNFGQMRSPTHAIYTCRGRAVIALCADFQDPPSLLPQFVAHWRAGAKIVLGVRESEPSGPLLTGFRHLSYRMLSELGDVPPIHGATGFGLYDAEVVDILRQWNDPEPLFRAMLVETGFAITTISYRRPPRERGESKNNWRGLTSFALSSLPTITRKSFRLAFVFALTTSMAGLLLLLVGIAGGLWLGVPNPLVWTGIGAVLWGVLLLLVGMLGIQVTALSDRVRNVPLVIERERINFDIAPVAGVPRSEVMQPEVSQFIAPIA